MNFDTTTLIVLFLLFLTSFALGILLHYLFNRKRLGKFKAQGDAFEEQLETMQKENKQLEERLQSKALEVSVLNTQIAERAEHLSELRKSFNELEQENRNLRDELQNVAVKRAEEKSAFAKAEKHHAEQEAKIKDMHEQLKDQFHRLATKIMDNNAEKFTKQNSSHIKQILEPLKERISSFEKKVESTHTDTVKNQALLKQQIENLSQMHQTMSTETLNLTKALKGDAKMRGNWGELVLQKVLEKSGLERGREYELQVHSRSSGRNRFSDAVIYLPQEKLMVVDSKVSLNAYERYVNAAEDEDRERFLNEHLAAVRHHVEQLSSKNYQLLHGKASPNFVLMFMPIESAFALALKHDTDLYGFALEKNIVMVTPTTLLATLRTIDMMWQNERQQQNALEIATSAGRLYDKFVLLTEDYKTLGNQLDTVQRSYDKVLSKLDGRGNLSRKVEKLRKLGARTNKQLPPSYVGDQEE